MYKASCLCGVVKVEVRGPITDIIHCHCSLCRKSTGTAYATNGFVETDFFKVVEGREDITHFEFKPGRKRHFCRHCASPIYSSSRENPQKVRLRLGILDTPIAERPMSHNFVTSKADWENLDAQLPRYERFEPGRG
ncbi:GFA family protein [Pseudoalteromonas aurantia]|uniref:Aldehyde-activating protein n=1 Tax=Pseudoalteromonas aurantia TaxID=43654 RepID=A0A5S3VCE2_9GAMM|nr:GFA family protein [Pseudoalteromonas aurantia]TMO63348.1 aldehyde-activating protein [Pseudoalteromonas aurantia]TMO69567.1 aldehyde-activating protein [Pseudoalteromonas aurantia]TMO74333.1 aldehyde-activating protein [Pseudoalteromonas aurantia]